MSNVKDNLQKILTIKNNIKNVLSKNHVDTNISFRQFPSKIYKRTKKNNQTNKLIVGRCVKPFALGNKYFCSNQTDIISMYTKYIYEGEQIKTTENITYDIPSYDSIWFSFKVRTIYGELNNNTYTAMYNVGESFDNPSNRSLFPHPKFNFDGLCYHIRCLNKYQLLVDLQLDSIIGTYTYACIITVDSITENNDENKLIFNFIVDIVSDDYCNNVTSSDDAIIENARVIGTAEPICNDYNQVCLQKRYLYKTNSQKDYYNSDNLHHRVFSNKLYSLDILSLYVKRWLVCRIKVRTRKRWLSKYSRRVVVFRKLKNNVLYDDLYIKYFNKNENYNEIYSEIDFKNSSTGIVTEFTGIKEFTTNDELSVLNNYATIGALLSWDEDSSKYTVWNGDPDNYEWDPQSTAFTAPPDEYGTVIAVCVGLGKWAATGWSGLTTTKSWCPSSNYSSHALYMYHPSMVHGTGKQNTAHVLENHDSVLVGTIWADIKSYSCGNGLKVFLPSKYELLECQENLCDGVHKADQNAEGTTSTKACSYNKQIAKLLSCSAIDNYWSSSQDSGNYGRAFYVSFSSGTVNYDNKDGNYRSLALLRF